MTKYRTNIQRITRYFIKKGWNWDVSAFHKVQEHIERKGLEKEFNSVMGVRGTIERRDFFQRFKGTLNGRKIADVWEGIDSANGSKKY